MEKVKEGNAQIDGRSIGGGSVVVADAVFPKASVTAGPIPITRESRLPFHNCCQTLLGGCFHNPTALLFLFNTVPPPPLTEEILTKDYQGEMETELESK